MSSLRYIRNLGPIRDDLFDIYLHAWVFIQNRVRMGVSWNQIVDDIMETLQWLFEYNFFVTNCQLIYHRYVKYIKNTRYTVLCKLYNLIYKKIYTTYEIDKKKWQLLFHTIFSLYSNYIHVIFGFHIKCIVLYTLYICRLFDVY